MIRKQFVGIRWGKIPFVPNTILQYDGKEENMALRVNQDNFEEKVLKSDKPVLLDFYSDTCIPCKRMAGTLGDVEEEYEGKINVYKVNVNYDDKLAEQYQVMSAPTLIFLVNGQEQSRLRGAAAKEEIVKLFEGSL